MSKYLDLTRWLECANGGKFEWGTGTENKTRQQEKKVLPRAEASDCQAQPAVGVIGESGVGAAAQHRFVPLEFNPTNVNMCLFRQFKLFRKWRVTGEQRHECGFAARILMSPCARAIVDKATGLLDSSPAEEVLRALCGFALSSAGARAQIFEATD